LYTIGVSKIFSNPNQLEEWVDAALGIQERYGIGKALGYLIGEKVYNLVDTLYAARKICRIIEEERKKPDYKPIREVKLKRQQYTENLDQTYEQKKIIIIEAEGLLLKFAFLINQAFDAHEIRRFFASHPRLGIHGHVSAEEQYEFMVTKGAIPHSIETEVQDALILGDMMKYFGVS
jgi:hypothetical protein